MADIKTEIWTEAKAHPYASGIIIFVIGAGIIYLLSKQSAGTTAAAPSSSMASSVAAYDQAQLQLEAQASQQGAQITAAQIAAGAQATQANAAVAVATGQTSAALSATQNQDAAQVQIAALTAGLDKFQAGVNAKTNQLGITTQGTTQLAAINAGTAQTSITAQEQAAIAAINANVSIQNTTTTANVLGQTTADQYAFLNNLLNKQTAAPAAPSDAGQLASGAAFVNSLPANAGGSTNSRIANVISGIDNVPGSALFTQNQVKSLLLAR